MSSDNAAGMVIAVAKPCSARAVSSIWGFVATPPSSDAPISSAMPVLNILRRPNRSARRPNRRVKPAAGRTYAVVIQGSPVNPSPTPAPTLGSATLRIEKSTDSMNPAPSSTNRINRCLLLMGGGEVVSVATRQMPFVKETVSTVFLQVIPGLIDTKDSSHPSPHGMAGVLGDL